jgi:hypothetical protein
MTSNESGWWMTQGNDNGGNDGSGDVVVLAVSRVSIGQCNESGRGEEEDMVMVADGHRQQSTKSGDVNGGCDSDSNNNNNH